MNFSKKYFLQNYNYNYNHVKYYTSSDVTKFCIRNQPGKKSKKLKYFMNTNNQFKYWKNNTFKMNVDQNDSKKKRNYDAMNGDEPDHYQNWKKLNLTSEADEMNLTNLIIEVNSNSNRLIEESSVIKNSIQKLYEIKRIKKVTFDMLSSDGPSHKPVFKFSLSFVLNDKSFKFEGEGASKKNAKSIASLKALFFLNRIPQFFSTIDYLYIQNLIKNETTSILGLTENIDNFFLESLNQSQKDYLESETASNSNIEIQLQGQDQKNIPKSVTDWDIKIKEILNSKSSLIILNHLVPNSKFELKSEEGSSHAKIFKIDLKISKTMLEDLKTSKSTFIKNSLPKNLNSLFESDSVLISSNESDLIFHGSGNNKKQAKSKAAQLAIESIFNIKIIPDVENNSTKTNENEDKNATETKIKQFSDNISEMIKNQYLSILQKIDQETKLIKDPEIISSIEDLSATNQNKLRNVYAAVVQSKGFNTQSSKIICITSGTKCINGEFMSQTGTSINDCHAEILSVRLLRKYLYKQLKKFLQDEQTLDEDDDSNIFEKIDASLESKNIGLKKLYRLKKDVSFHLYISSAPCGDGRIFSMNENIGDSGDTHPNRKVRGLLRAKLESGEGTIPVLNNEVLPTWDSIIVGERLRLMSCSDKLCKYNVVGIQGALLSHFIETIYFESIIIGGYYHKSHLARALYDRVSNQVNLLPTGFKLNVPHLSSITNSLTRRVAKSSNKSILWSEWLNKQLEILSCKEGKTIEGNHSEVCKYELFKDWTDIYKQLKQQNVMNLENDCQLSYHDVKYSSKDYQKAKLQVYLAFKENKLGTWITKPFEQNHFIIKIE